MAVNLFRTHLSVSVTFNHFFSQTAVNLLRTHTGVGHTGRQRVSTTFLTRNNSHFFLSCAPDGVRTSGLWILSPTLFQLNKRSIDSHYKKPKKTYRFYCYKKHSPVTLKMGHGHRKPRYERAKLDTAGLSSVSKISL